MSDIALNTKIFRTRFNGSQAVLYWNGDKVWPRNCWFIFEFSDDNYEPTSALTSKDPNLRGGYNFTVSWSRVSTSPNRWKLSVDLNSSLNSWPERGLRFLFYYSPDTNLGDIISSNMSDGTCKIVDAGKMDFVETTDRMCKNCTGLTEIPLIHFRDGTLANGNEMFAGCVNVTSGALALYQELSSWTNPPSHSDMFKNCGSDTQTGAAELAQIPVSWGGTFEESTSTELSATIVIDDTKYKWLCSNVNCPDWSTNPALYLFTTSSVSQYAGVNMRKKTTQNIVNGLTQGERYYMPAFFQFDTGTSGALSWLLTTTGYNGYRSSSQSTGDMPGTLSYENYGPMDQHFGTYDSTKNVYFGFLVTNVPMSSWQGLTDAYGIHGNDYFQNTTLKWFV